MKMQGCSMRASARRWCLVAASIVVFGPLALAQEPSDEANGATSDVETITVSQENLAERIEGILLDVADNARNLSDPGLKLSCQLQAAALLWSREPDRARGVYQEAFDALVAMEKKTESDRNRAARLQSQLLSSVARHDPALAERFAKKFIAIQATDESAPRPDPETLVAAAIEMLPGDPDRAMALGRLALGDEVTPEFMRLLVVLRGVDANKADQLFTFALNLFARTPNPRIAEIQMLAFYIGANGQTKYDGVPTDVLRGYLDTAFRSIMTTPLDSPDAPTAYFLGRQLMGGFSRYLPERVLELELRISLLSRSTTLQREATPASDRTSDTPDASRARAASAAIERDDYAAAHVEAAAIEDDALQTRVYAQASLRLVKLRRFDEASREIERVPNAARRATLLIQMAYAVQSQQDKGYAIEILTEAGRQAARASDTGPRLQALFSVAAAFVEIDPIRAFEALQAAVDNLNKASRAVGEAQPPANVLAPSALNFDTTLTRLARFDFDRALLLALQFDTRGHRLLAQLAVCRGGLANAGVPDVADSDDSDLDSPISSL